MGLDMYLYGIRLSDDDQKKGIWEECAYWRKANQVHDFFNKKYIKGDDPYAFYEVDEEDLEDLKLISYIILMNRDSEEAEHVARALLPPNNFGCFFESSLIEDEYFEDIEYTYHILKDILENKKYDKIFYAVSW